MPDTSPVSVTLIRSDPPSAFMNPATVLFTISPSTRSRLCVWTLTRAVCLNSTSLDSPPAMSCSALSIAGA